MTSAIKKPKSEPLSIAIEGVIGVGKTTLAHAMAERLGAVRVNEDDIANPFLDDFYKNRSRWALSCQIAFLHGRLAQFRRNRPIGLPVIADHCLVKDPLFARVNIEDERERRVYQQTFDALVDDQVWQPRVIIYLTAKLDEVRERIRTRGRKMEYKIDMQYLDQLVEAYEAWFQSDAAMSKRVVVVKADGSGIADDVDAVDRLIEACRSAPIGLSYCNPVA